MKLIKYPYHVLMINDIFSTMELVHQHMDMKIFNKISTPDNKQKNYFF